MSAFPSLDSLMRDIHYGVRQLRRAPLFAIATVLTLGLTIGANSALFAVVNAVVLRPLPYPRSDRIVSITMAHKGIDANRMDEPTTELALTSTLQSFESLSSFNSTAANAMVGGQPERIPGSHVSQQFFEVLGVRPTVGRTFVADELKAGGPRVVILSEALWTRAFGRNPGVVGETMTLDGQPFTVVGVIPGIIRYPVRSDFWLPMIPRKLTSGVYFVDFIGRLRPHASIPVAREELIALRRSHERALPARVRESDIRIMTLHERLYGRFRPSLVLLLGSVGCVLLVACANVANLMLARATARRREFALRAALGANRSRLVRQLLIENVIVAALGAIPGIAIAAAGCASSPRSALPPSRDFRGSVWMVSSCSSPR